MSWRHGRAARSTTMATVRDGKQGVLVVVDVQVGVMAEAWDADRVVGNVGARRRARPGRRRAGAVGPARRRRPHRRAAPSGSWPRSSASAEGEPVIGKDHNSSFEQTDARRRAGQARRHPHRTRRGVDQLVHPRHRLRRTRARLRPHADPGRAHHRRPRPRRRRRRSMRRRVINDLNTVMTWISYPGRSTTVAAAADVDFAALAAAE